MTSNLLDKEYNLVYIVTPIQQLQEQAGGRVVTHSPLTPEAQVQLPDAALSSWTQATILSGSVKCVATSKQWVTDESWS